MTKDHEFLLGQIVAQGLLLRALYAKLMTELPAPRASMGRIFDSLIESMREFDAPSDETRDRICQHAEIAVREFQQEIESRFVGLARSA